MPAGDRTLLASGKRRISATGKRVLSNASGPCCCPTCTYATCGTFLVACDCQAVFGVASDAVCCERNTGTVSVTFPTITPSSGWAGEAYADVFADFMAEVSGQTLSFDLDGRNRGYRFFKYGKVTQISSDGCTAYGWRIEVFAYYDDVMTFDMKYNVEVQIVGTETGGPWTLGQDFPCTDADGNPTGAQLLSSLSQLLYASVDATGNCYGPTENLVLDLYDTLYIDTGTYEIEPWDVTSECGPEDNSGFPASVDMDLSQFYPGLPVITMNNIGSTGMVDLFYNFSGGGTIGGGTITWAVLTMFVLFRGFPQTPVDCDENTPCCLRVGGFLVVTDSTDPGDPIVLLEQDVNAYKCTDVETIPGTYTQVPELGGGTVILDATP